MTVTLTPTGISFILLYLIGVIIGIFLNKQKNPLWFNVLLLIVIVVTMMFILTILSGVLKL